MVPQHFSRFFLDSRSVKFVKLGGEFVIYARVRPLDVPDTQLYEQYRVGVGHEYDCVISRAAYHVCWLLAL
jgi:hypothetical protein